LRTRTFSAGERLKHCPTLGELDLNTITADIGIIKIEAGLQ